MADYELLALESESSPVQWKEGLLDIACGSVAGAAGKIIEYPFDTIKVRLQTQALTHGFTGPLDCLRQSLAKPNAIQDLYRGISSPIVGAAAENASLFFTYNLFQSLLKSDSQSASLLCGGMSGAVTSFILTPFELVKCQMQVLKVAAVSSASGSGSVSASTITIPQLVRSIWKEAGFAGFWRGQTGTLIRETGGSAAYFGAYETVTKHFKSKNSRSHNTNTECMLAGACAGISYNFALFPADTIKSRMQTATVPMGFVATAKDIWQMGGIKPFYRGCGITLCRSAPASAIIFLTYEKLKSLFS